MAVNYQMDVINPFQAALQGYGAGAQILQQERTAERQVRQDEQQSQLFGLQMQEAQARAAKLQQEIKAAQERDTVYGEFYDAVEAGNLTPQLVAKVTALDEKLGTYGADMMADVTAEQKKASFANLMAPATALATGDVEAAKANLQTQYDALVNAGDEQGATAVKGYLDQLGTPQGQTFVQAALLRGASMMDEEGFAKQLANIQAIKSAPLKATLAELDVDLREAQIAREKAATRLDARRAEIEATTGVEVQSSRQLDDGTTVMVMKDGTRRVLDPKGTLVEGEAAQQAIAAANKASIDIQGQRAGARSGATMAQGQAKEAFVTLGNIRSNITNLDKVATLLDKPGVSTGVIESQLPTWDASTIELRNMRSRLGLDVVGAVTFGALSEGELNLALDVALPTNLSPPDLKKWVLNKKAAQEKLSNYFSEQVRFLSIPGNTLGDWEQHQINRSRMGAGPGTQTKPGIAKVTAIP